jgi:hypothetical protein
MIIGYEKQLSMRELFEFDLSEKVFTWECMGISNEEHSRLVENAQSYFQIIQEDRLRRQAERERQEQERKREQERRREHASQSNAHQPYSSPYVNETIVTDPMLSRYRSVMDMMRNSERIKTSPGFYDRIKECEEFIMIYESKGELSDKIHVNIRMMQAALGIRD